MTAALTLGAALVIIWHSDLSDKILGPEGWQMFRSADNIDAADIAFWETVRDSKDEREFEAYLEAFPSGKFVSLAQLRLEAMTAGAALKQADRAVAEHPTDTAARLQPPKAIVPKGRQRAEPNPFIGYWVTRLSICSDREWHWEVQDRGIRFAAGSVQYLAKGRCNSTICSSVQIAKTAGEHELRARCISSDFFQYDHDLCNQELGDLKLSTDGTSIVGSGPDGTELILIPCG